MSGSQLCFMRATELAEQIRLGEVSAREVMDAHLRQIERINPQVNAIVTLLSDLAMESALEADEAQVRGESLGPLHGLPIAHKDLIPTKGIRTTFGSPIFKDFVPSEDALIVQRMKNAGAITIGKTNTPEFGAGSQTFNEVFGATCNPYDLSKTCGGSSGGAAVSLACGMLPIADGSDTGGSLRNPASFCNVVGLRPSPGRVPSWPKEVGWFPISVDGPMARTVEDVALLLSTMAGPDARSPICISERGDIFRQPLERDFAGTKVAWSHNLDSFAVDPRVTSVVDGQRATFESIGCTVDDDQPNFRDADEVFKVWRAWAFELKFSELLDKNRDRIKDTIVWNVEEGRKLTGPQLGNAEKRRTALYHRVRRFMETYEFLILPVTQVPPFDIKQPYVEEINGEELATYIDWMKSCYFITVTGLPAISVPCGFTRDGLPIGVQIVGRHQDDLGVLQLAYAFQQATRFWKEHPALSARLG